MTILARFDEPTVHIEAMRCVGVPAIDDNQVAPCR